MRKRIVVVGGGPAGLMAAGTASANGAHVTLVEKMARVGRKLSITGNGRCNLTALGGIDDLIKGFPGNGRFLYSAFNEFSNHDLVVFFNKLGLKTKVERGKAVFPLSDRAHDVVKVLSENAIRTGVDIQTSFVIQDIMIKNNRVIGLSGNKGALAAEAVIVATGGMSYPGTGSTGDGYTWAKLAGHKITDPRPGLVPLVIREKWIKELQGLSLKNIKASAYTDRGQPINNDRGDLLFTHYGISGPLVLSMSHDIGHYLLTKHEPVTIELDLKPELSGETLNVSLQECFAEYSRKKLKNALNDFLPPKIIPVIMRLSGIEAEKECHQITRSERQALLKLMKKFNLTVHGTRPLEEAIVTAGGVDVKEIYPKTMESKLVKGLFFAGEVLDVDGYTGGYNLQAAFSTGYVAGKYAAMPQSS